jgi:hypothetical protein
MSDNIDTILQHIVAYLVGSLDPAAVQQLSDSLRRDPVLRREAAQLVLQEALLVEIGQEDRAVTDLCQPKANVTSSWSSWWRWFSGLRHRRLRIGRSAALGSVAGFHPRELCVNSLQRIFRFEEKLIPVPYMAVGYPSEVKKARPHFNPDCVRFED